MFLVFYILQVPFIHKSPPVQLSHDRVEPQPSLTGPHVAPMPKHVFGVHARDEKVS
jgi:hypothetical protein